MNFQEALENLIINDRIYKDEKIISEESIKKYFESHIGFENDKNSFVTYTYLYSESGGKFYPVREVICYSGAPGTGKTSFINTLKKATGRKLETISCAGLKEPKEYSILGDKNKPSLVAWAINKNKCKNPIILLDELEKVTDENIQHQLQKLFKNYLNKGENESGEIFDEYYNEKIKLDHVTFFATVNYPEQLSPQLKNVIKMRRLGKYSPEEKTRILEKKKDEIETRLQKIYGGEKKNIISQETINHLLNNIHEDGIRQTERALYKIEKEYIRAQESGDTFLGNTKEWLKKNIFPYRENFSPTLKHYFLFGLWGIIWMLLLIVVVKRVILRKEEETAK